MFSDSPLEKALGKQVKKQIDALKSLNLSNKIGELNQTERSFLKNQISTKYNSILNKLIEIK